MAYVKEKASVKYDKPQCHDCIHAHKVEDDEYDKVYECDAEEYDIKNLTCFVPREN